MNRNKAHQTLRDLIILALFCVMMVISDLLLNWLPNVHLLAMFIILLTRFYRAKALFAIYTFIVLDGVIEGFFISTWVMYLYIWAILWGVTMLLPKKLSKRAEVIIYPLLGGIHGLTFGILTSPAGYFLLFPKEAQNIESYLAYIASGFPYDILHMIGNVLSCLLVLPLLELMRQQRKNNRI